jgi:hypothetical protein
MAVASRLAVAVAVRAAPRAISTALVAGTSRAGGTSAALKWATF